MFKVDMAGRRELKQREKGANSRLISRCIIRVYIRFYQYV